MGIIVIIINDRMMASGVPLFVLTGQIGSASHIRWRCILVDAGDDNGQLIPPPTIIEKNRIILLRSSPETKQI